MAVHYECADKTIPVADYRSNSRWRESNKYQELKKAHQRYETATASPPEEVS